MTFSIRRAQKEDAAIVLTLIKDRARYEKLEHEVVATLDDLNKSLFGNSPKAHVLLAYEEDQVVGFVLYFYNYSTFLCKNGIYVEDLYVNESVRGKGYGKKLLQEVCIFAQQEDCGRVEWWCLDWNKKSIRFYESMGAEAMDEWTVFRLTKNEIRALAQ